MRKKKQRSSLFFQVTNTYKAQGFCPNCNRVVVSEIISESSHDALYCDKCQREIVILCKFESSVPYKGPEKLLSSD